MKVRVDPALCTGHGRCYALAPDTFDEDERGHAIAPTVAVPTEQVERVRLALANCPEQAITLEAD